MRALNNVALFSWFPIVMVLFSMLPKHRALIVAVIAGALFLPEIQLAPISPDAPPPEQLAGLLICTKQNVISASALLAALVFDFDRLLRFRPRWFDVPMLFLCFCPFLSDYANKESLHDSLTASRDIGITWAIPYFLGRIYFKDPSHFRDLALGMVLGGLAYTPVCLAESILFPFFNQRIYGFFPGDANECLRSGGYRPVCFLQHGLAVGLWMVAASMAGFWLWWTGAVKEVKVPGSNLRVRFLWVVLPLVLMTFYIRSAGALALGMLGLLALLQVRWVRWPVLVMVMLAIPPVYMVGRLMVGQEPTGWLIVDMEKYNSHELMEKRVLEKPMWGFYPGYKGIDFQDTLKKAFDERAASSYIYRVLNEDMIMEKGLQHPWLGWGDQGQARVRTSRHHEVVSVGDALWILTLGDLGIVGLTTLFLAMLLPVARFVFVHRTSTWSNPILAAGAAAVVILLAYMNDNLSNNMFNPTYVLLAGGLASVTGTSLAVAKANVEEPEADEIELTAPGEPVPAGPARPGVLRRRRPSWK